MKPINFNSVNLGLDLGCQPLLYVLFKMAVNLSCIILPANLYFLSWLSTRIL